MKFETKYITLANKRTQFKKLINIHLLSKIVVLRPVVVRSPFKGIKKLFKCIFLFSSLWCRSKARLRVPLLHTQCLQSSAENGEQSALTLGSYYPAKCEIQREDDKDFFYVIKFEQSINYICNSIPSREANFKAIILYRIQNAGICYGANTAHVQNVAKLCILCFIVTNVTQIIELFMAKEDLNKLFACFSVLSFCLMGFLKLWSLLTNQERWRFLIAQASSLEHNQLIYNYKVPDYESEDEDDHFSEHIKNYTKNFTTISTYLSRIYSFTAVVFIASPFFEYAIYMGQGKEDIEPPHILPGWAPLDTNAFGYIVTVLAEGLAAVYCVRVHVAFDLTAVGLMIFIHGQFSLLHAYSERIGGKGNKYNFTKKRDDRAHFRIKQCHQIHVLLLSSVKELGKLIENILGIYFFVATLTLCSVAVQLKWQQLSATQLISLLQYMCATLTQLFLFCHYGDAILNESSVTLGRGPFGAACWCVSSKIRRELAFLCVGMSKPCKMRAGPFNSLDLPSFIQIVRAAYSYYAVLRQTSE